MANRATKDIVSGSVGAVCGVAVTHPLDTIKTRMQVQTTRSRAAALQAAVPGVPTGAHVTATATTSALAGPRVGVWQVTSELIAAEGTAGLYRGLSSPLLGASLLTASLFFANGQARTWTDNPYLAGAMTAFVSAPVRSPMEMLKCQLQVARRAPVKSATGKKPPLSVAVVESGAGAGTLLRHVVQQHGLRTLTVGMQATFVRDLFGNAIYFGVYQAGKQALTSEGKQPSAAVHMVAGGLSGMAYWASVYPLDVVKTRLQSDSLAPATRRFTGMVQCFRATLQAEGVGAFYQGLTPSLVRAFLYNGICFVGYEWAMRMCNKAF